MITSPPRLVVLLSTTLLLSACQRASDPVPDRTAPVAAAQRIALDPVTRLPVASVAADEPAAVLAQEPAVVGLREATEVHLPDGTVGVRVDKRYFDTITVCRQADGRFSDACPASKAAAKP